MKTPSSTMPDSTAAVGSTRMRSRAMQPGGLGSGTYTCEWRAGNSTVSTDAIFAGTHPHKAWRPQESSP